MSTIPCKSTSSYSQQIWLITHLIGFLFVYIYVRTYTYQRNCAPRSLFHYLKKNNGMHVFTLKKHVTPSTRNIKKMMHFTLIMTTYSLNIFTCIQSDPLVCLNACKVDILGEIEEGKYVMFLDKLSEIMTLFHVTLACCSSFPGCTSNSTAS